MFSIKKKAQTVNEPMDVDAVMKKFDRESNTRIWEGKPKIVITSLLAIFALFCISVSIFFYGWSRPMRLTSFVAFIVFLAYIIYPAKKGMQKVNYMPWYDVVLMILGTASFLYYTFNSNVINADGGTTEHTTIQVVVAVIGVLVLAEACRRSVGLPIVIVAACFIVYALTTGLTNPNFANRLNLLVHDVFYANNGVLNTPIMVCCDYIAIFIIFGAFLERTGIADFFIKLANSVVGGVSGGPAKVAVVASALEGMVSGSSVANTVGSGSVTIPLMKRTGYKPEFAAAAEASASTGGQIMPPIMGAAAFLMVEYLHEPFNTYGAVVLRAILPALLYFTGVFIAVHLEAKKEGLKGIPKQELPKLRPLLKKIYLLIPLGILIVLVSVVQRSIQYAAIFAILAAIVVTFFDKQTRMTPKKLWETLAAGGQGMVSIACACGIAGVIAGVISCTGLFGVVSSFIEAISGGRVIIALFFTMICCIILGMGVPTTANFCIMASTCAPILIDMGVEEIAAYFFVFYFGIVADLTPPVALAAYAGAAIARANPMKTAVTATKLAIGAFIVPYVFALNPAMMFINTTAWEVILIIVTSLVGIFAVSASLQGYFIHRMPWYERILSLAGGLLLIVPGIVTDAIGLGLAGIVVVLQLLIKDKAKVNQ